MPSGYEVTYLERDVCGADTATFRFSRPEGYDFAPGQWFSLRLDTSQGPVARTFSHSSAPGDPFIELMTRLTESPFKCALAALGPGQSAHIAGPGGRLSIGDEVKRIAFLAGGVGITPVRSILRDAASRKRRFDDALVLYGNHDETCVPFLEEFEAMADIGVRVVLVYEEPPMGWTGEAGFITAEIVRQHVDLSDGRPLVVTGPPAMVSAIELVLDELDLPVERRLVERF